MRGSPQTMRRMDERRTGRSRSLRRSSTRAELTPWRQLRDRQLGGFKFVRQEPEGPYYPDFVCRERHLIVEVDGGQHSDSTVDRERDALLTGSVTKSSGSGTTRYSRISKASCRCSSPSREKPLTLPLSPQAGRGNAALPPHKRAPECRSRLSQKKTSAGLSMVPGPYGLACLLQHQHRLAWDL